MATFSKAEEQLIRRIRDGRLKSSLALLREAMEDVWSSDAPRIIKGFPDHGPPHCERVVGLAKRLLAWSKGGALADEELYVILGGVYMHDIGMQCDVVLWPEVKQRAERLGASFDVQFRASTSHDYHSKEQKCIRDNHHYLSAAWIGHAREHHGDHPLYRAAASIPEDLVDEMVDVCKYHRVLPIKECESSFRFCGGGRLQLVAALVRLADELDVDAKRVSLATVKIFAVGKDHELYWWLHNRTFVDLSKRNVLLIKVRVNQPDYLECGPALQSAVIESFKEKNASIMTLLAEGGIPIVVSDDSCVTVSTTAEPLPPYIREELARVAQHAERESGGAPRLVGDAFYVTHGEEQQGRLLALATELGWSIQEAGITLTELAGHWRLTRGDAMIKWAMLLGMEEATQWLR